ncbi:response regulator transcription factor [Canibacter sp. lx-72]|nr:response regulator transcription factor [Canibacter zhuwentaonis]
MPHRSDRSTAFLQRSSTTPARLAARIRRNQCPTKLWNKLVTVEDRVPPENSPAPAPRGTPAPSGTSAAKSTKILIVEDDSAILNMLEIALRHEGWHIYTARSGSAALAQVTAHNPDLIVLDIMLPEISGIGIVAQLRETGHTQPVLFLTALDEVTDKIKGLTAGGDDYVTKPFSVAELIARIRALLRRSQAHSTAAPEQRLQVADIVMHEDTYEVTRNGVNIELTTTEFELLRYLMRNTGRVLSREQIIDRVWSYDYQGKTSVVELYISYLRRKLEVAGGDKIIHTVRGVGYTLRP